MAAQIRTGMFMHAVYRAVFNQKTALFFFIKFRKAGILARCPFAFHGRRDRLTVTEYDDKLKNNAHISQFFVGRLSYTEQSNREKSG